MNTVFYDCYRVLSKVYSEGAYISEALNSTEVEKLKFREITKICYGVLDKDIELSYYIKYLSPKAPKVAVRTLLKIGFYCIKYLNKQPYGITNEIVELSKKLGKSGTSGFINAVLRSFGNKEIPLPTEKYENYSIVYNYPVFAIKLLIDYYGEDLAKSIMSSHEEHNFVRIASNQNAEDYFKKIDFAFLKTALDNVFDVKGLKINDGFNNGVFTFQSIGSVAICDVLSGGKTVLDACAAPGGKSVYLAEKYDEVVAFELHKHRVELIKSYAERMKANNVLALNKDSSIYDSAYEKHFDSVLCDVPCSGFGTLGDNPDIRLNKDENNCFELTKIQNSILSNCSNYVAVGGELIYSTCSIFEQENDAIIQKFLSEHDGFYSEKIQSKLESINTKFGLQFLPHISMGAGFYVCKLKRIK